MSRGTWMCESDRTYDVQGCTSAVGGQEARNGHPFGASLLRIPALRDVRPSMDAKKSARRGRLSENNRAGQSEAVVHIELDRMGGHAQARHFFHLQFDIAVDHVISEYTAGRQELAILVERFQRLVE